MRFAIKIVCCALVVVALAFCAGATLIMLSTFNAELQREKERALDNHDLLRLNLETASVAYSIQNIAVDDELAAALADQIGANRNLTIINEEAVNIYGDAQPWEGAQTPQTGRALSVRTQADGRVGIVVLSYVTMADSRYTLLTAEDITYLYNQREEMLRSYGLIYMIVLAGSAILIFVLSILLTRPIASLASLSSKIAGGDYSSRAKVRGNDEIAALTEDFNRMAEALSQKMTELTKAVEERESFVASFAHELKTPLTSIIGYADVVRSQQLSPDRVFRCANTIYTEGCRLEALSIKLLELMVLRKQETEMKNVNTRVLGDDLLNGLAPLMHKEKMRLSIRLERAVILAEPDLLKTLLYNLVDNARKASQPGSSITLVGKTQGDVFEFTVTDQGRGIPQAEIEKITQAFYMVDKSRARAQNGAGLGLALCEQIANLHGSSLKITSKEGEGTTVCFHVKVVTAP